MQMSTLSEQNANVLNKTFSSNHFLSKKVQQKVNLYVNNKKKYYLYLKEKDMFLSAFTLQHIFNM